MKIVTRAWLIVAAGILVFDIAAAAPLWETLLTAIYTVPASVVLVWCPR